MLKVSVLYPNREDTRFKMTYYLDHHIPLVRRLLGSKLKSVSVEQGISAIWRASFAAYVGMGHLGFDSVEDFSPASGFR